MPLGTGLDAAALEIAFWDLVASQGSLGFSRGPIESKRLLVGFSNHHGSLGRPVALQERVPRKILSLKQNVAVWEKNLARRLDQRHA